MRKSNKQPEIEKLKAEIERLKKELKKRKKYGLVWEDKPEDVAVMCKEKLPVLKEVKNKEIITDKEKPVNLLIEGDNYHALSVLNYTHAKKVDVIYIDPTYNTGSKDFKYNDRYVDTEDSYRHSKWLSFMEKRLRLAKNLLKNTGAIFIQIDDNEIAQLRLLCDEIFGPHNFRNTLVWAYRTGGSPSKKDVFGRKHDYILLYSRSDKYFFNKLKEKIYYQKNFFGAKKDENGNYYALVNLRDVIEGEIELFKDNKFYKKINVKPVLNLSSERIENFPTQKPIGLIKFLLEIMSDKNSIICDFFAGTGTTGEAVLELNKEDGGERKFILCTDNENNIATNICYPRIKKAILGDKKKAALGGNLKYFKTDFVDAEPTDKNKIKLTKQATEMLCVKEGTFELIQDKGSFKIFKNSKHYTGIIFDQSAIPEFKEVIKDIKGRFSVYIFSLGDETFDEEFADVKQKVKLSPIPEVILRVYRRIFK